VKPREWTLLYFSAGLATIALWYGSFLLDANVGIWDWSKERFYFTVLLESLRHGRLPAAFLALPPSIDKLNFLPLVASRSYFANPEVVAFSPFFVFAFLPAIAFIKLYFFLHLIAALVGTWLLARRLALPPPADLALFALAFLNPWLMQHLAIGYSTHITYCWFPLLLALLLDGAVALAAALMALVLYEGGLHLTVWLNLALGVYALASLATRERLVVWLRLAWFWLLSALLCAPRLYATAIAYRLAARSMRPSYHRASELWGLLTDDRSPLYQVPAAFRKYNVLFYDGSLFVGRIFLIVFAAAALHAIVRRSANWRLLALAIAFALLGQESVWKFMATWLPPLRAERYPYRLLWIAVMSASAFMVIEWTRFAERGGWRRLIGLALLPIAIVFYLRDRSCAEIASSMPDPLPDFSYAALLDQTARSVRVPTTLTAGGASLASDGAPVELRFLTRRHAETFDITGARPSGWKTLILQPLRDASTIRLEPRSYHRWPLTAGCLLLFAACVSLRSRARRLFRARDAAAHR
jgi:hypothetical protein